MEENAMHPSLKRTALAGMLALSAVLFGTLASHAAGGGATASSLHLGAPSMQGQSIYLGFYDSHKDSYINTDDSNQAQATAWHINYAPLLAHTIAASSPEYFVSGRAAAGQLAVFGSEPPDKAYSPLWQEFIVTWKAGVKPVLLTSDNQILALAKKGKLTNQKTNVVLNAPILKVKAHS
jgi:hypothetical protein